MPSGRTTMTFTLVVTMVASSFSIFALAVLAAEIIDELEMSRSELGVVAAVNTSIGALTSPATGRLTDRIGAQRSVMLVLVMSSIGMAVMAMSTTWWWLVVSAAILGVPQGWGNPSTNALIASRIAAGQRGAIMGIKQSGVTLGVFLAGITLPGLSRLTDWHGACGVYSGFFALFALIVGVTLPADATAAGARDSRMRELPGADPFRRSRVPFAPAVWSIAAYAFLLGGASGAVSRFLALFANEELGMTVTMAGFVIALAGLLGMATRVWAARLAETRVEPIRLLVWLAYSGVACSLLLVTATSLGSWVMWPTAVLFAFGFTAWNAVAMLAVVTLASVEDAGRASGVVILGFLGGHSFGSPLAGLVIDTTDSYQPVWWAAAALSLAGSLVLTRGTRRRGRVRGRHYARVARLPSIDGPRTCVEYR